MINVLYSGNNKVFDGVLTTTLSILKRTNTTEPFHFYILTMDLSEYDARWKPIDDNQVNFLDKIVKTYNKQNTTTKIDVTELYKKEFLNSPNNDAYCSPYTLLRLFIDLLDNIPDKILYLDIDIMFNRDITLLYNTDIEGFEYAACQDHYGKYFINPRYINAGMLLFNIKECKKTGLLDKARQKIKQRKWMFADQDALWHSTSKNKILKQMFNDQKFLHKHTVVRHFSKRLFWLPFPHTANIKQWHIDKVHKVFKYHQFDDILNEYSYYKKLFDTNGGLNEIK